MKLSLIENWVGTQVKAKRLKHIVGVVKTSEKLAILYQLPVDKALIAAWLHDCAKEWSKNEMRYWIKKDLIKLDPLEKKIPALWHPHAAAAVAAIKWKIRDPQITEAIRCHTLGNPHMGSLAQLLFISDFIEPGRNFQGVIKARQQALAGLKAGVLTKSSMTIKFLLEKNMIVHPRLLETWNAFNQGSK